MVKKQNKANVSSCMKQNIGALRIRGRIMKKVNKVVRPHTALQKLKSF